MNKNTIITIILVVIATLVIGSLINRYNDDDNDKPKVIREMQHEADEVKDELEKKFD